MDSKEFDLNKFTSNSFKGWVLEVNLEYPKKFWELHKDYPLAPNKTEIKREMIFEYQRQTADLCNIPNGNICASLWELTTLLETRIKTKRYILY